MAKFYMTPSGAGSQDGSSWANAFPKSQMGTALDTLMEAGDTLYLGSGAYGATLITLASSGAAGNPKRIIGVDTGSGRPVFSGSWSRVNPSSGTDSIIMLSGTGGGGINGVAHWVIENLEIYNVLHGVKSTDVTSGPDHTDIVLRDLDIHDVRHGMYLHDADNLTIENCTARRYTKHGFRLEFGCNNVTFDGCTADLSDGDSIWWDYAEAIPFGFLVNNGGAANTNVTFRDCVANNHLRNGQGEGTYWNGDGFVAEGNTVGLTYIRCIAINNEDAGFDLKQANGSTTTLQDCVAVQNSRNFRFWYQGVSLHNCVATYPRKRGVGISSNGIESLWLEDATLSVDYFTAHGDNGTSVKVHGTGSATLTNSILSFSGASGGFTSGSVTLGSGTVTYRPGSGIDPDYVNPSALWDGVGNDMNSRTYNSRTYGMTKGYYQPGDTVIISPEADTYVWDANPSTNYGTDTKLLVKEGSAGFDRISYLRFPVSSLGGTASSAMLKLTVVGIGGEGSGNRPVEVRQLCNDDYWSETEMTWNNRPSTTGTLIATIPDAGTVGQTYSVDVTDYINAESGGDGKASLVLIQPANASRLVQFGSREDATNRPVLAID
jgi:hypothetical protein